MSHQQQQDYDMDRQHISPPGAYSDRTPTATDHSVDLLSALAGSSAANQISYSTASTMGSSRDYQSLSPFEQDAYRRDQHLQPMMASMPRYTDSIQRTPQSQHHQLGLYGYSPTGTYPDMSGSMHSNPATASGRDQAGTGAQRYPVSTDLYSSDMQSAPLSGGYGHGGAGLTQVSSLDSMRLTDPTVVDYRQSMTSYHRRESESLQQQRRHQPLRPHMSHDGHAQEHMQTHSLYSQGSPMLDMHPQSRRNSLIGDLYTDQRAHHGPQRSVGGLEYDMAPSAQPAGQYSGSGTNNNSSSLAAAAAASGVLQSRPADASGLMQFSGDSYASSHASSSIPMSNSHPRHLYAGGGGGGGGVSSTQPQQQQQQQSYMPRDHAMHDVHALSLSPDAKRQEGQHPSRMTHLQQTPQSERQPLHLPLPQQQQHHYQQPPRQSPKPDPGANAHHQPKRASSYRTRPDDLLHMSRPSHTHSAPNVRELERPTSNPRTQSMPGPATTSHHLLRPSSTSLAQSISPLSTSDNESGDESNVQDDEERNLDRRRRGGKGREDSFSRGQSHDSGGAGLEREEGPDDGGGGSQGRSGGGGGGGTGSGGARGGSIGAGQGEGQSAPPKKRKKSKMHECEVCQKKFPRPSGLKTHMNTHSNEKPFPCGFPGCTRTFGVRSNAKRHLRTHGIIPPSASNSAAETPYVVDFSTPLIMPPHPSSNAPINGPAPGAGAAGAGGAGPEGAEPNMLDENAEEQLPGGSALSDRDRARGAFKLRWMPLSLTSRLNAAALRVAQDGTMVQRLDGREWGLERGQQQPWGAERGSGSGRPDGLEEVKSERDVGGGMGMETEDLEGPGDIHMGFSDAAMAARLTIPLPPVVPSHRSSSSIGGADNGALSQPSGGPAYDALSPANSLTSPPSSAPPGTTTFGSASGNTVYHDEERNSYHSAGSQPYHPSQFSGVLPGPAIASSTAAAGRLVRV